MSREIRRVPLGYEHPTTTAAPWFQRASQHLLRGGKAPTLHAPHERFIPLHEDYASALAEWETTHAQLRARTGHLWEFYVEYHLTSTGQFALEAAPMFTWETGEPIVVRDAEHLHELVLAAHEHARPQPAQFMSAFDDPPQELAWCLYESVTEGTPITPVFATADELVEHLCTVGTEWAGPMQPRAARRLVADGSSLGACAVLDTPTRHRSGMSPDATATVTTAGPRS